MFSMSTMEGFACGLGVHKNIQIITDCLCYIPGIGNNSMDVIN